MPVYYFNITYKCNSNCLFCAADIPLHYDKHEMTYDAICNELQKNNVGAGDQVVINGGEPTLHPDFLRILQIINERQALIDLFSNGMHFSDELFVENVIRLKPINIRIPIFGSKASTHDYFTGVKGSFDKVIKGIENLCRHLEKNTYLEIKLLLAKNLVKENIAILDMLKPLLNGPNVRLSLNPLLISDCVISHSDELIDSYTNMIFNSKELIDKSLDSNVNFSMSLIPFCTIGNEEYIKRLCIRKTIKHLRYYDKETSKNLDMSERKKKCVGCKYIDACHGFPESYIKYYGDHEIVPFNNDWRNTSCL